MTTKQVDRKRAATVERKSRFSTAVDEEAMDFIKAIEDYKLQRARPFPSWTEVLIVMKAMGYRRVAEAVAVPEPDTNRASDRNDES